MSSNSDKKIDMKQEAIDRANGFLNQYPPLKYIILLSLVASIIFVFSGFM